MEWAKNVTAEADERHAGTEATATAPAAAKRAKEEEGNVAVEPGV